MSMSMTTPAQPNENAAALRDAIRSSDPQLSKFRPLSRILTPDDFNTGLHGWVELGGNYNGKGEYSSLDRHFRDFRPPQLSTCNFFDVGTHGAMSGTYALKLATRPYPGHTATGIRRLTMSGRGLLQIEAYLAYKAEAVVDPHADNAFGDMEGDGNRHPSEAHCGAFTVATDLCGDDGAHWQAVEQCHDADQVGHMLRQCKFTVLRVPTPRAAHECNAGYPYATDFTAPEPDDWRVDGQPQDLCMNEV